MLRLGPMVAAAALLLSADVSGVLHLRPPANDRVEFPPSENLPVLPDMSPADDAHSRANTQERSLTTGPRSARTSLCRRMSRLALVRFVDGELVRVVEPLPAGKNGFHLKAGVPCRRKELRMALGSSGAAINPGDKAQITSLEFKDREIIVDINGGGRGKKRLRDRIHMEVAGCPR